MDNTLSFKVEGMNCGGCARAVRQALESVPGITVDRVVAGEPVEVRLDESGADRTAITKAVERAGYRPVFED
jgi:copper chaperone CopZ